MKEHFEGGHEEKKTFIEVTTERFPLWRSVIDEASVPGYIKDDFRKELSVWEERIRLINKGRSPDEWPSYLNHELFLDLCSRFSRIYGKYRNQIPSDYSYIGGLEALYENLSDDVLLLKNIQ